MKLVLDIETTWTMLGDRRYPLPFDERNKIVTVQWKNDNGYSDIVVLNHNEYTANVQDTKRVQDILDMSTLLIGHNIKFDVMWLRECGFTVTAPLYDTMINEYIRAKGQKVDLSLAGSALRCGLTLKLDILKNYMKQGINTDAIPLDELKEYALGDCQTTWELYQWQQEHKIEGTQSVEDMSNEFLNVLIDMERNGTYIDEEKLNAIGKEYLTEHQELGEKLKEQVISIMGDQPFNLASNEQLSQVVYSRKVKDKKLWKDVFNIGSEIRGSVRKKKHSFRMSDSKFRKLVLENTEKVYRTTQTVCLQCRGIGNYRKTKKDGSEFKKDTVCKNCHGAGVLYIPTDKVAGFKITPQDSSYAADGGFGVGKKIIENLLASERVKDAAKVFLKNYARYGAISSYLTSFIDGIRSNLKSNSILHVNFNQCITATGRLSSSNPNFQNLPRDKTFPIRQVVRSRWSNGSILDCDLAQLEFRVAAILSGDSRAKQDILDGIDVHAFTAKVLTDAGQPTDRQTAKAHTFKPLYGGLSGTEAERTYYKAFLEKYSGIAKWHMELSEEAIRNKEIISKSGRRYGFPTATRQSNNKSSQFTQIVNYCVQGFATGDITPCIMIELDKEIKKQALKSLLILTVHDSVTADVYPGEEDVMIQVFKKVFDNIPEILYNRFSIVLDIPIGYELSIGYNWANKQKVA